MNRWTFVLNYFITNPVKIILDVGVDHGSLPIQLLKLGLCKKVIASDIRVNPLRIAKKNFAKANLLEKVDFRLGDGLAVLKKNDTEIDVCLICGLGPNSIISVLKQHFLKVKKYLIQSPVQCEKIRKFCLINNFFIESEAVDFFRGRYYETMIILPNQKSELADKYQVFFGKYNLQNINSKNIKNYYLEIFRRNLIIFKRNIKRQNSED